MTYLDIYTIGGNDPEVTKTDANNVAIKKNMWRGLKMMGWIVTICVIVLIIVWLLDFTFDIPIFPNRPWSESKCEMQSTTMPTPTPEPAPASAPEPESAPAPEPELSNNSASFLNKEPFTNDLPYQLDNQSMSLPEVIDDYNDILQKMSLDSEVINNHNQYVNDRNKVTSTASFSPSRSDNQDIVTTWGLTKPSYIPVDPSARNVPSQDPEQGSKPVRLQWA